jgi:uncharacterized radical SAM superfamily Fe-S cluster-containing enzyme
MNLIKKTKSICPECFQVIEADIFEEDGKVYLGKECSEHGRFKDIYWSDFELFKKVQKHSVKGEGVENPNTQCDKGHPFDCGLCPQHKSHTSLAIIDVTNRCNLRCPICFANAAVAGYVYEPSLDEIRGMMINLRSERPIPVMALQLSGGEPTVRDDLPEIIKMAKKFGFRHVEVNSNGLRIAAEKGYCRKLMDAGVSTIYLQFDGVTREPYLTTRGADLLNVKKKALQNCREDGLESVVLVPTIVKGVNDHQLGDIIRFAVSNFDVIRCVNFQPVSLTGRINYEERMDMRITIPDCLKLIEKQTEGQITVSDFFPVPFVVPIARAVGALRGRRYPEFTTHEHCGMATFVFIDDDKIIPATRYGNLEALMDDMNEVYRLAKTGSIRRAKLKMASAIKHVNFGFLRKIMLPVLSEGTYEALGNLMRKTIMIGMMHFMDPFNFDLERLERCCIHYAVPDGKIIPFCAMNTIHRAPVEKQYGVPINQQKSG